MALAKKGDKVRVHYTGKLDDGTVFESSIQREPIEFIIGQGQFIPGIEQAVLGMNPGETRNITVDADSAFGPHRDEMVLLVARDKLPDDAHPAVGGQLQVQQADGQVIDACITDVTESMITIDANHPLAGKDLNFDLELVEIV